MLSTTILLKFDEILPSDVHHGGLIHLIVVICFEITSKLEDESAQVLRYIKFMSCTADGKGGTDLERGYGYVLRS